MAGEVVRLHHARMRVEHVAEGLAGPHGLLDGLQRLGAGGEQFLVAHQRAADDHGAHQRRMVLRLDAGPLDRQLVLRRQGAAARLVAAEERVLAERG